MSEDVEATYARLKRSLQDRDDDLMDAAWIMHNLDLTLAERDALLKDDLWGQKYREAQARITQLEGALERLANVDPFDESELPFITASRDLQLRMEFARNALQPEPPQEGE